MAASRRVLGVQAMSAIACCAVTQGAVLTDRSSFSGIAHTLNTFEFLPDGTPLIIPEGQSFGIGPDFTGYGFVPVEAALIAMNPSLPEAEQAIAASSSPDNIVFLSGGGLRPGFSFVHNPLEIHSVGISVTRHLDLVEGPLIAQILGPGNVLIEEVVFEGDLIDGQFGPIQYGWLGFTSATPIQSLRLIHFDLDNDWQAYDDLMFSTEMIPAPGGVVVLMGAGGLSGLRRRR